MKIISLGSLTNNNNNNNKSMKKIIPFFVANDRIQQNICTWWCWGNSPANIFH